MILAPPAALKLRILLAILPFNSFAG